ncbi:hypothetical protein HJG60_008443 [Phyllostomus discolor]|uniref:Uncharacterized protein n=1 Tax=Phyllostomus discolor TaxID=89673 RepID=A0A833Z488_9CHIR|nr:hypothetical protein HJG60_008443 [Phyllostomus discolor]
MSGGVSQGEVSPDGQVQMLAGLWRSGRTPRTSQALGGGRDSALALGGRGACFWGRFFLVGAAEHRPGSQQSPRVVRAVTESGKRLRVPPAAHSCGWLCWETPEMCFPGLLREHTGPGPRSPGLQLGFPARGWLGQDGPPEFSSQEPGLRAALQEAVREDGNRGGQWAWWDGA